MATTAKQDVRRILDGLPEEASLEDIQYHLYVLQRIERGREDVETGRTLPQDEVEQRLARWLDR
jgi:predicted transcriptional regulator